MAVRKPVKKKERPPKAYIVIHNSYTPVTACRLGATEKLYLTIGYAKAAQKRLGINSYTIYEIDLIKCVNQLDNEFDETFSNEIKV